MMKYLISLIKDYNLKNADTKFELRLLSRFEAINVLVDSLHIIAIKMSLKKALDFGVPIIESDQSDSQF